MHTSQLLCVVALTLIGLSFALDCTRLAIIKQFAQQNGLERIGVNPFSAAVRRVKAVLPIGQIKNRVNTLEKVSMVCWLASTPLLIGSVLYK
jgi:hypothetical protein